MTADHHSGGDGLDELTWSHPQGTFGILLPGLYKQRIFTVALTLVVDVI